MVFVSNDKPSEVLKPGKEPFDLPSSAVRSQLPSILGFRFLAPLTMWRDHFNLAFIKQSLIKAITVIGFVADQLVWSILGKASVYGCFNQFHFMGRSAFNVSGDRNTRSVCDCHDLGSFAALCLADSKTPFFAGAKVPSMNASRI